MAYAQRLRDKYPSPQANEECRGVTIARLRAELASARELHEAERAVVEAAVASLEAYHGVNAIFERQGHSEAYRKAEDTAALLTRQAAKRTRELMELRAKKSGT